MAGADQRRSGFARPPRPKVTAVIARLCLAGILLGVLTGAGADAALASSVGAPSLSLSSHSASASQVSYVAKFTATTALTAGVSTVTLTAPAGTVFPAAGCGVYAISDPRTHQSAGCLSATVAAGSNAVTITTAINVGAGDPAVVTANGVKNTTTSGATSLSVATSSDSTPVSVPFTLTAATAVGTAAIVLTSHSASASEVTYVATFKSTNGLTTGFSTVTLTAPAGTVFPATGCGVYAISDPRTHQSAGCLSATVAAGSNAVTITTAIDVSAGDPVVVTANGVGNPPTSGAKTLALVTTSDPAAVSLPLTLTAATAVRLASVALSSTAATASAVSYVATFTTSNGLTTGFSTVTLTAPAGTVFPATGCGVYAISDPRTHQSAGCLAATVAAGSNAVTITTAINVSAGDPVVVTVNGVGNPPTSGAKTLSLVTSADPVAVSLPYTLSGPASEGAVALTLSSHAATASQVTYAVSYTATNALTTGFSKITLTAPAGTVFPSTACGVYAVTDDTTGDSSGCLSATVSGGSNSVTILSGINVVRGDRVTVTANGVNNVSTAGSKSLSFSTTSDPLAVSLPFVLSGVTREGAVALSLTSYSATASQVTYAVSYDATNGLTAGFSKVTLTAPAGTVFPSSACGVYVITDVTTGDSGGCLSVTVSTGSNAATLISGIDVVPGDQVVVTANGVTNPSSPGSTRFSFSTTSDPLTVQLPFVLTGPTSEGAAAVALSNNARGATGVTYTVTFTATNGFTASFSEVTLTGPNGTVFPPATGCGVYVITDLTTGDSGGCSPATVTGGSDAVTVQSAINIAPGDQVSVVANGVTNTPTSFGTQHLGFSTTSDPLRLNLPFTLT